MDNSSKELKGKKTI